MGKECLVKLGSSAMGKLPADTSGAGHSLDSSSYPFGALHLSISNIYLDSCL